MSKELIALESSRAVAAFGTPDGIEALVGEIEAQARSILTDATTDEGRKFIASLAYKVSRSKTLIDDTGAEIVSEWKEKAKAVDAKRKLARDRLDALRDEIRRPVDEFEAREKARVDGHKARLEKISEAGAMAYTSAEQVEAVMKRLADADLSNMDEFTPAAQATRDNVLAKLAEVRDTLKAQEAERQELERLRAEKAEQEAREREVAAAAAAEAKAKAEAQAAVERAEREKAEALARAEKAELEAQQKAAQAAEAERQKIEREKEAQTAMEAAYMRDRERQKGINRDILQDVMAAGTGITMDMAKAIVIAMREGRVRHVKVAA